jgi:hypothetical protein
MRYVSLSRYELFDLTSGLDPYGLGDFLQKVRLCTPILDCEWIVSFESEGNFVGECGVRRTPESIARLE